MVGSYGRTTMSVVAKSECFLPNNAHKQPATLAIPQVLDPLSKGGDGLPKDHSSRLLSAGTSVLIDL